jgi:amino acid transporter
MRVQRTRAEKVALGAGAVYDPQDGSINTKPPEETRMHLHLPNTERLSESTRTAREAFWLTIICGVAVYAFFMVIGSVSPSGAALATLVAGGLLVLYAAHAFYAARHMDSRDPRVIRARERRGF